MITSAYLRRPIRSLSQAQLDHAISAPSRLRQQLAFYEAERSVGIIQSDNWHVCADILLDAVAKRRAA